MPFINDNDQIYVTRAWEAPQKTTMYANVCLQPSILAERSITSKQKGDNVWVFFISLYFY